MQIVKRLQDKSIDLQAGIIGFVDSFAGVDSRTLKLTANFDTFRSFLNGIKPYTNSDYPEASMYAVRKAVERFSLGDGRSGALKTILAISDVVGHNGSTKEDTTEVRDCGVAQSIQAINQYANNSTTSGDFRFFYDVPDAAIANSSTDAGASEVCGGFNAKTQMEAIINGILPDKPIADRGGPLLDNKGQLNWPLTESGLVDTLVPLLESKVSEAISGTCVAESAILYDGSKEIYTWKPTSIAEVLKMKNSGNELPMDDVIGSSRAAGEQELTLKIERCCYTTEQISDENFATCQSKFTQSIKYEIVNEVP